MVTRVDVDDLASIYEAEGTSYTKVMTVIHFDDRSPKDENSFNRAKEIAKRAITYGLKRDAAKKQCYIDDDRMIVYSLPLFGDEPDGVTDEGVDYFVYEGISVIQKA